MSYNETQEINHNYLIIKANENKTTPAIEAFNHGRSDMLTASILWPEPVMIDSEDGRYSQPTLFNQAGDGVLPTFVKSLADSIQFPVNTAYLHALGVLSSAMNMNFKYDYHGQEKPTNLYVITAQPPSSGKSGINSALTAPVRHCYNEIAQANAATRAKLNKDIKDASEALEKAKGDKEIQAIAEQLTNLQKELEECPDWVYAVDDATPEALESIASRQMGMFNVISDEADSINVILGKVYGEGKSNYGIFLKGWDGDYHSPARITRSTKPGHVYGSIAVIAQDESIDSILEAGLSGRGISERIIMLREKSLLGSRDFAVFKPVCKNARKNYEHLISNIVNSDNIVLTFSKKAEEYITAFKSRAEPELGDDGKYSNAMLRGVIGKADKQLRKLASVLHVADEWATGAGWSTVVSGDTVMRAVMMFSNMIETYIDAADSQGYSGANVELDLVINAIARKAERKGLRMSYRELRDSIKNLPAFKGIPKLTQKIKNEYIPDLIERNVIIADETTIFINPRLK